MEEIFVPAYGFENIYEVSNKGNIKNRLTGKLLKINNSKDYPMVDLWDGKHHGVLIHRLMMLSFGVPNPLNLPQVNHKDENKRNNFLFVNPDGSVDLDKSNLEWCSVEYNNNYGTRNKRVAEKMSKPIKQIKNGEVVKIWKSQLDASIAVAGREGCLFPCLKGITKTAYGYQWEYA